MKAAVLYGNGDIRFDDYPAPVIRPGAVKIRVRVSGICGSDIPRVLHNGAHFYPIVLGHEFSGDVVEVGEGVNGLKIGDTVTGVPLLPCMSCGDCQRGNYALCKHYSFVGSREQGGFAEYVVVPEKNAVKYEPTISYEQAAMFEPYAVALHGINRADYKGGEYVAILGVGTIGLFAMQWAGIFGARKIVVFDINAQRLALARKFGADAAIDTSAKSCYEEALNATRGNGFGFVFETAGSPATMRMAFDLAGNGACLCFIGTPHVDLTFTPQQWENLNRKELRLVGSWMSYSSPFPGIEWELTAHCFATGQLRFAPGLIFKVFPLSRVDEAFALFKNPKLVHGKVLLVND